MRAMISRTSKGLRVSVGDHAIQLFGGKARRYCDAWVNDGLAALRAFKLLHRIGVPAAIACKSFCAR